MQSVPIATQRPSQRGAPLAQVVGRLPGIDEQAQQDMVACEAANSSTRHQHQMGVRLDPLRQLRSRPRTALLMLSGAVSLCS